MMLTNVVLQGQLLLNKAGFLSNTILYLQAHCLCPLRLLLPLIIFIAQINDYINLIFHALTIPSWDR